MLLLVDQEGRRSRCDDNESNETGSANSPFIQELPVKSRIAWCKKMKNVMNEKKIMIENESSRCAKYRYSHRFNMSARRRDQLKLKFSKMLSLLQVFDLSFFSFCRRPTALQAACRHRCLLWSSMHRWQYGDQNLKVHFETIWLRRFSREWHDHLVRGSVHASVKYLSSRWMARTLFRRNMAICTIFPPVSFLRTWVFCWGEVGRCRKNIENEIMKRVRTSKPSDQLRWA